MKNFTFLTRIKTAVLLIAIILSLPTFATTYTASASGNWSSTTTWAGGNAPPFSITTDAIIIPAGISVTMDNNADFTSVLASLEVEGTLTSASGKSLTIGNLASLTGAGTGNINVGIVSLSGSPNLTFSGGITVDTFSTSVINTQLTAMVTVAHLLKLSAGTLTLNTGGHVALTQDAIIQCGGGLLAVNGGTLNLASPYNVVYLAGATTTGLELLGPGLNNVTVSVGTGNTLTMISDVTVDGNLTLATGTLATAGNSLTVSGNVTAGNGSILSSSLSNITINTTGGITGPLNFSDSSKVNNLTINTGAGNKANISGYLSVTGTLTLTSGTLSLNAVNFFINGNITGSGNLGSDSLSNIAVSSLITLNFANGSQMAHNLTITTGFGGSVILGSNLTLSGMLNLPGYGTLDISGDSLTINGNITGTGMLVTSSGTGLFINTNANIISPLNIVGPVLGTLSINLGSNNIATVNRNMNITGALKLQSGTLDISGYDLALSGTVSGNGNIASNAISNIAVTTTNGTGGKLNFATGSALNNLTVNTGIGSRVQIGGEVNVTDTLALTSGILDLGTASLTISGTKTGTGGFSGTGSSNLTIDVPNGLASQINFTSGGQMLHNFTINTDSGMAVTFGTVLQVSGTLSLTNGTILNIQQDSLILNGDMAGAGQLSVNSGTVLQINSPTGLTSNVVLSGVIGTFVLNTGQQDSVVLGSDLNVSNSLSLQNGILVLKGHNLTVTGNIASGGNATISSNNLSNINVNTSGAVSGGLAFTKGANSVNNFSLHTTGSLPILSDLTVDSTLTINAGMLDIGNDTLIVATGGHVTGGDSSAYIIASGSGAFGLYLNQGDTSWVKFAVGTRSNYAPVSLQLNSGSDGGLVYVSINGDVLAQGTSGSSLSAANPLVNATWMVEPSFTSHVDVNMMTSWQSAIEVNNFNRDSAYIAHYTNGAWDQGTFTAAVAANGYLNLQRNHITTFSPFAVFGKAIDTTGTVGIIATTNNDLFQIFPNPATDNLIIKNMVGRDNMNIDIISVTGQVIASYKLTDYTTNISLTSLSAGNYFVKLYNADTKVIKPFVKM